MFQSHHRSCGNLKFKGQNARLRAGGVMLLVALGGSVFFVQADVARIWRLVLFFPFAMAAFGAWQGLFRVCPGMSSRGYREDENGEQERIVRPEELEADKGLARRVVGGTVATAFAATLLVFLVP